MWARGGGTLLPPSRVVRCLVVLVLAGLPACSKTQRVEPVDINEIAIDAQSDIDNYAAARAATDHRIARGATPAR